MGTLDRKTVVITGAAQGIGRSLAIGVSAAGARLVLADIDGAALRNTAKQIEDHGGTVLSRELDITDSDSVERLQAEAKKQYGGVDVLVNNAAIGAERISPRYLIDKPKFWDVSDHVWLAMLRVNVFGAQLMSRIFVGDMLQKRWGRIVNITTSLDTMYRQGTGGYGPCKAALEAASRVMASDLADSGVTANVLVPGGPVNTRMIPTVSGFEPGKLIQPETMCAPLIWLCSEEANHVNGVRIVAQKWKPDVPLDKRLAEASAPIAWPQLGAQSVFPAN
jgi:NAD(P)-dependent dehydrogenase (short-subunit alcohol dehydrogenase family)